MLELLLLSVFLSVTLAVLATGFAMGSQRKRALRRAFQSARERNPQAFDRPQDRITRLMRKAYRPFAFLFPDSDVLRRKMIRAGYNGRTAPLTYGSIRVMLLIGLPVVCSALGYLIGGSPAVAVSWFVAGIAIAIITPPLLLRRQIAARRRRIRTHLPDALDLMVVCVEAGLGLDAAIFKVADELGTSHPEIAHEFQVVTQLVNAGMPRAEALRGMTERTGVSEVNSLVITLLQSERLGASIAKTLRIYADQLRTRRRQSAEEAAQKAPIKMLIPMVLFVLPALFIVVVGPAIILLRETFASVTR